VEMEVRGMRQCIECAKCARKPLPHHAGEWVERLHGHALRDYLCDWCGTEIKKGELCAAWSCGLDTQRYYPWEYRFISPR
jgi:hypothetical protein